VVASIPLMQRLAEEIYRKLRNTFRFLLGNLHGFDPELHARPFVQLEPLDQYMLARTAELTEKIHGWYQRMEFHRVYHALNQFCASDLSAVYLDVLKDRMYTFAPTHPARRSAQTAIWRITEALVRLIAPILSFTADEIWQYLPKVEGRPPSVHIALFPAPQELAPSAAAALLPEWQTLFAIRDEALKALEAERKAGRIGKALEAKVRLELPAAPYAIAEKYRASLKELCNVSQVEIALAHTGEAIVATPLPADGNKCERCWNYSKYVGVDSIMPTLCDRCLAALAEMKLAAENASEAAQTESVQ